MRLWIRKIFECLKLGLMDHPYRNMEDSCAERDLNYRDLVQVVSEKKVSLWPRDCSFNILAKNVAGFCSCPRKKKPKNKKTKKTSCS